jgi:hypothetical protein
VFSAPNSYQDFTSANSGGSFVISDETLHTTIQELVSANNYLYLFGTTSINVISGVQIISGITVFSNTNVSAAIGSSQVLSVVPYYRSIAFSTPYGFYILSGTTPQKISDHLDGVFPLMSNDIPISAGTVLLFDVICLAFMFKYVDPVAGKRTLIAIQFNKKWLFTSQGDGLTRMATSLAGGSPRLYATNGTQLFNLLFDGSALINQTIKTKLWDMGDPVRDKQTLKVGIENISSSQVGTLVGTVDTEITNNYDNFNLLGNTAVWINNSGQIVSWTNVIGATVTWIGAGYYFGKQDVQTSGKYIGVSLYGAAPGYVYNAIHLQYELRAIWTTMPT